MSGGININFRPSVKQRKALDYLFDDETLFVGYGGAAFGGKSYLMCYWLTIMSIGYPNTSWGLGRRELVNLKKTTLVTLFKVFQECNIKPLVDYKYNQQDNVITFSNGSRIYLIDTAYKPSDPLYTRFGGLELTGCAVDESAETSYGAIKILFTRLGRRNNYKYGLKKKFLETFNPAKNHIYNRYYKPYKDNKESNGYRFIVALPKDNPSPEVHDYINDIMLTSDNITIERLIHGNFEYDDDPSALMTYDKICDIFHNNFVTGGERFITADIARYGRDKTVIGVWDGWRLIKIVTIDKNKVTEAANAIRDLATQYFVPNSNIIVDEDGVGGGVVDILECNGFVNNSRPLDNPENNEKENYNNLKSQCYFKLASIINQSLIFVECDDGDIKNIIIQELEQVKQHNMDKDGKKQVLPKDDVKELLGRSPDYSDMMMMRAWFEYRFKWEFSVS